MNRRSFIKHASCGAMGSTTLLSTIANLGTLNGAIAAPSTQATNFNDYKALVCILFSGGMDSYNMLIPTGTDPNGDNGYNEYRGVRTDLSIAVGNILPLSNPQCTSFRGIPCSYSSFGIHPQMTGIQSLFNTGKLAFMSNIGTLVEPLMNKTEYQSSAKKKPLGIYSHSDQVMQWQTSVPQSRDALGVGGRLADLLNASNSNPDISMNISLAGKNTFQRGQSMAEYAIRNDINTSNVGLEALPSWWSSSGLMNQLRNTAVDNLVSETYSNLLQKTYANSSKGAIATFEAFKTALTKVKTFTTTFPNTQIGNDLSAVAKVISVAQHLGAKRQIFFVDYGGWDMHSDLLTGLNTRLQAVSQAMKAFYDAIKEITDPNTNETFENKVTTFTISDFARTATSNGVGSDHAWGGNSIVMGGAVNGGRIYGAYPKMDVVNYNRNISFRGNFIPAISTDEMYAELALWYGVSPYDLCYVLPNLGNFYSYAPNYYPVGFMNFNGNPISTTDLPQGCLTY